MKLFIDFALITGILFCAFILFSLTKKKEQVGKIMIILFILILSVLINYYGYLHKLIYLVIPTQIPSSCINVFAGPLFLVYIESLYMQQRKMGIKKIIHFIFPAIYTLLVCIPPVINYFLKNELLDQYFDFIDPLHSIIIVYSLIYCVFSLKRLYHFRKLLKKTYSNLDNKDLKWMEFFLIGSTIVISIDLLISVFEITYSQTSWSEGYLTAIALVFLMIYLGYYGVSQSKILIPEHLYLPESETKLEPHDSLPLEKETVKTETVSEVDEPGMIKIKESLLSLMETEKPYLNEDLTLRMLASMLSMSDKKLSALLNQFMNTSFYDFINGYRVEEAKIKIVDPAFQHLTLLAIGYESGFKSKTSFNRIFKNITGISPSEHKKKNQNTHK